MVTRTICLKISYAIMLLVFMAVLPTSSAYLNFLPVVMNQKFHQAFGEGESGHLCGCILDATNSRDDNGNNTRTYLTIPKVKIIKNETLESQTEGHLSWKAVRSLQLGSIITRNFFLGNFSSGTASSVALNTLNVKMNDALGLQITGGNIPTKAKAQIIKAAVNRNGTLEDIKTIGKPIIEFPFEFNNTINNSSSNLNSLSINMSEPGDYLLLISLTYNSRDQNQETIPLIAVYEAVLTVK
jgi:hypothetical protein